MAEQKAQQQQRQSHNPTNTKSERRRQKLKTSFHFCSFVAVVVVVRVATIQLSVSVFMRWSFHFSQNIERNFSCCCFFSFDDSTRIATVCEHAIATAIEEERKKVLKNATKNALNERYHTIRYNECAFAFVCLVCTNCCCSVALVFVVTHSDVRTLQTI